MMIRAVLLKDVLWPQKQEDREEGGWKAHPNEKQACDPRICDPKSGTPNVVHRTQTLEREESEESAEQRNSEQDSDTRLPVIAERMIDEPISGMGEKQNEHMV